MIADISIHSRTQSTILNSLCLRRPASSSTLTVHIAKPTIKIAISDPIKFCVVSYSGRSIREGSTRRGMAMAISKPRIICHLYLNGRLCLNFSSFMIMAGKLIHNLTKKRLEGKRLKIIQLLKPVIQLNTTSNYMNLCISYT